MIEFRKFSFTYSACDRPVLSDISFAIKSGECVLLHGPSGCGKSTLCMTLNGIVPNLLRGEIQGEILIDGTPVTGQETRTLATRVGMVFQNPDNQLFAITVEEDVAFGPENLGLPQDEMRLRVNEALEATGLADIRTRQVHRLSGGQKQRTAIAGLSAMRPDILVFDEPTADLDPEGTREIIGLIHRLHKEEKKTIIIVEHKIREIFPVIDRIITLKEGKIAGDFQKDASDPRLLAPPYPRHTPTRNDTADILLDIRHLHFSYPDGTKALEDVSLAIRRSECIAFIGRNGSGKTTLTKCIKGLLSPDRGTVNLYNTENGCIVPDGSKRIGYLFQNPDHQIVTDQVDREISIGLVNLPAAEAEKRTQQALEQVNLGQYATRDPCTLSRGERQRLAVASILAMDPEVIIFDEPTTGQDYENLTSIMQCMEQLKAAGNTILMVTHDHELANAYADRIIVMENGKIVAQEIPS
ncbi:MAG: energy-coupling factor transporter ATPase [Methanoregula sp.]|nr:energy-coupling factor transporter ATPase [Methanoregula sp.]